MSTITRHHDYQSFLASKRIAAPTAGFDISLAHLNPRAFDWQRQLVQWAIRRGRAGLFPDTGLGKTLMQLMIGDEICKQTGGKFLILAPLAVGRQTMMEASKFGITSPVRVATAQSNVEEGPGITVTNYEKLHKFDAASFIGVGLDEGSILKSFDGKTRDQLISTFAATPYRYVFTATPSPNDIMEIGSYCEFLGIMSRSEMLSMFFTHDGGETSKWRLKGHAQREFFRWKATWAVMIRKPSDIGFSDDGYDLPPLHIHEHVVESKEIAKGFLFQVEAKTLGDQRAARRETIGDRVKLIAEIANGDGPGSAAKDRPFIAWCNLNDESKALAAAINGAREITGSQKDWEKELALIDFTDGKSRAVVSKPSIAGFGLNWQHCNRMAFCGLSHSYEEFYQAVRRIYRFGQQQECHVHVVVSDRDGSVLANIKRKQAEAERLQIGMVQAMAELTRQEIGSAKRERTEYQPAIKMERPRWL